jgi:hypothetical protein
MQELLRTIAQIRANIGKALRQLPFWPEVVKICTLISSPVVKLAHAALKIFPSLRQLEWLLEIESLTKRSPVLLALSMLFVVWRGLHKTSMGHIGTDYLIYPFLAALSGFNPFLGLVCGALFGIGDLVQKLLWADIYGASKDSARWGDLNYWGAIFGYIVAYSSLMCMGLLPGMLSRVARVSVRAMIGKISFRSAASSADGATPPRNPQSNLGAELAAAMAGGAVGGFLMLDQIAPRAEAPAFDWRPNPDTSCRIQEVKILNSQVPQGALAGAAGGAAPVVDPKRPVVDPRAPVPKKPREYEGRDNPWDPSPEKQREMWEQGNVVWDPEELKWRRPKPEEIPKPEDFPEEPPPIERQLPRNKLPWQCVSLHDEYAMAQSEFSSLVSELQAAQAQYEASHMHLLKQLMKAYLNLSWETASVTASGVDAVHGSGKAAKSGFEPTGGSSPGTISKALNRARDKVADMGAKIARLTNEAQEFARVAAEKARIAGGLRRIADEAKSKAGQLASAVESIKARAGRLADLDDELAEMGKRSSKAEEVLSQAKDRVSALEGNLNRLREARKAWEECMDADDMYKDFYEQYGKAIDKARQSQGSFITEAKNICRDIKNSLGKMTDEAEKYAWNTPENIAIRKKITALENAEFRLGNVIEKLEEGSPIELEAKNITEYLGELKMEDISQIGSTQNISGFQKNMEELSSFRNKSSKVSEIKAKADEAWQKFENQGLDPNPANISQLENELSAERGNFIAATNELQQITEAQQAARSERNALKTEVEAEKADLHAKQSELEAYERNAAETERRFEKAEVEAADADHKRFMKEAELRDTKYWKTQADEDLKRLEAEEGYPPSGEVPSGGEGPSLSEQLKPGIVSGFEQMLGKLGEVEQRAFGTQSPDEIEAILRQCRTVMERDLAEFQAKQAALDAARQLMQSLKPALDKCIEENASFQ